MATDASDIVVQPGTSAICFWNWKYTGASNPVGKDYSMQGSNATGYQAGSERDRDLTWSLSTEVEAESCGEVERACCTCGFDCSISTLRDCIANESMFLADDSVCGACPTALNDECESAPMITIGTHFFNSICAMKSPNAQPMPTRCCWL